MLATYYLLNLVYNIESYVERKFNACCTMYWIWSSRKTCYKDIPIPKPSKQQVRIKIEACGVNFPDTLIIENKYQYKPDLPFSPGGEVAGIIDELGDEVTNYSVGEKVMAMTLFGGFSEYIVVNADALLRIPKKWIQSPLQVLQWPMVLLCMGLNKEDA